MTQVLLTHSYHLANDPKQLRKMQPYAPLGTLYAAAALRETGISVQVFDTTLQDPMEHFEPILKSCSPQIVVIYEDDFNFLSKMCLLSMRKTAEQITELARRVGALVVAHGSDETDFAEEYLKAGIDYILTGEAEGTLAEFCHRFFRGDDVKSTPGLVWLEASGELGRSGGLRVRNVEWAQMPRPARELIDMEPYRKAWTEAHGRFSANVVASRGCPYSCNWCAKPISGNRYQLRPAEHIAQEMRELKELHGVQHVWFSDDIFALKRQWMHEFSAAVRKLDAMIPYKIQARADLLNDEVVAMLAESGCSEVWMGVESGSQKVLDAMDKNLRVNDVKAATERLRRHGIDACFFLQLGYPGEGWNELQETLALVRLARPDDIGVSISYPLPGTVFYERVQAELAAKRNWTDSDDLCVTFSGAYSDRFYRLFRDALHEEVRSWTNQETDSSSTVSAMWREIEGMEPAERRWTGSDHNPFPSPRRENLIQLHALGAVGGAI